MPTQPETKRIAAAVNMLRPDWPIASIVTTIQRGQPTRPYADLALALVAVALDPASTTPGRVNQAGPWWNTIQAVAGPRPLDGTIDRDEPRCAQPGHEHELARNCRACRSEIIGMVSRAYDVPEAVVDDVLSRAERTVPKPHQRVVHPDWRPTQAEIDMQTTVAEAHRHVVENVIPALAESARRTAEQVEREAD